MDVIIALVGTPLISALITLGIRLLFNHLNEKKAQRLIVNELLIEVKESLDICTNPVNIKMWWLTKYKTEAYDKYKGRITFLPEEVRNKLAEIVPLVEGVNAATEVQRLSAAFATDKPSDYEPIYPPQYLKQWLIFCRDELQKWQKNHSGGLVASKIFSIVSLPVAITILWITVTKDVPTWSIIAMLLITLLVVADRSIQISKGISRKIKDRLLISSLVSSLVALGIVVHRMTEIFSQ